MSQSIYPFDTPRDNESELNFDQFTFEELQDPQTEESPEDQNLPVHEEELVLDEYTPQEIPTQPPLQLVQSRLTLVRHALGEMKEKIDKAIELIEAELPSETSVPLSNLPTSSPSPQPTVLLREGAAGMDRVVEGVFDGQNMVGSDGNGYAIAQNYCSKSKLVEGDAMKLTITQRGSFIYKQIGPVERVRIVGILQHDQSNNAYYVRKDSKRWSVLSASVTYFRGNEGDEAVIIVPRDYTSSWAAVENIIKRG